MPSVDSSAILRIDYEADTRELAVTFRASGRRYIYFDFPPKEYAAFLAADSKGGFFNARVKNRYTFRRDDRARNASGAS